jgi:hypothetical protein
VNFNGVSGNVCASATNACLAGPSKCLAVAGTIPTSPGGIQGSSNVCYAGTSPVPYSVLNSSNTDSYAWTVPSGATIQSGQGTNKVSISYDTTFTSGLLCVRGNNACGSSVSSCKLISDAPVIFTNIIGSATITQSQKGVSYSVSAVAGATGYQWIVPAGVTIVSGQGTRSVIVDFDSGFNAGSICIVASNGCGASSSKCISIKVQ